MIQTFMTFENFWILIQIFAKNSIIANTLLEESSEVEEEYDYYDSMDSEDAPKDTDYFFQARSIGFGSSNSVKSQKAAKKEKIGKNKHINFLAHPILAKVVFKY